ncbi:MAG TPA: DHHA1 domain-containing protein [Vicinamibacterales bacterium]|nr:DHHA1 domain-containing protein [Vicinamibacterales bacterium]
MTERLYYTDPYLVEFDAAVVGVEASPPERPDAVGVVLDRTAFYPTSGGQPFDVGTLGAARVVEVVDRDGGGIVHLVDGDPGAGVVHGTIDWTRRFDHMQQHTGQHVLSAAFDHLLQVRTVSFHLGAESATIDLSREVSVAEIAGAEAEANRVVWEDRPVSVRFADAADAAALPLRKESKRDGVLRIIDVDGFDVSACGGTHVARTGAIGIIAVAGSERFRGGTRLEFVCGGRALSAYRALRDTVAASVRLLSVLPADLPAAIERMQADAKTAKRDLKDLQTALAAYRASELAQEAETLNGARVVIAAIDGADANGLKAMAAQIVSRPGHAAILLSAPPPCAIVVARAADVTLDSGAILKQLVGRFGGKGGGKPELAQGGGLLGDLDAMRAAARQATTGA